MRNDGRTTFVRLLPALLVLVACGGAKAPDAKTGVAGGAAGTTGTAGDAATGAAGTTGTGGTFDEGAPDGGEPDAGPALDADSNPEGGTVLPPYSGGIVSVINSSNWNETTIHPFSQRRMLVRDQGDPHLVLLDFGKPAPVVWKAVASSSFARGIQLIGNNQVLGSRSDGYEVFDLTTGQLVKTVRNFPSTTGAYRMANGEMMLAQSATVAAPGQISLSFLDKTDRISHAISYQGYTYVRMPRPTRNQTFLVPCDIALFEGDASGKVLWTAYGAEWGHIWEALQMSDGNVLVATFFGASLDIVDRDSHLVTKRYGSRKMPMAATYVPNAFTELQILPNGNFITANWPGRGGGRGAQVIEFNPAGDVVWFYKQDPTVFLSTQGILVLDGMDPARPHAQEISPDGTWQPVPTP